MGSIQHYFIPSRHPWWLIAVGLLGLYLPTFYDLATTIWSTEAQGHGPIVLTVCIWLLWRDWDKVETTHGSQPQPRWGWPLLVLALLLFLLGRSQRVLSMQTLSLVVMLPAIVLLLRGTVQLRAVWFPLFFLVFLIPLPSALVDAVTQPMKLAVSTVAANLLYFFDYPIARTGVILQIGPYQLLVADACAGLHTLFTLEAMGLLYLNVVRYSSAVRNIALAILIVPISFAANVIRVIVLSLITFHLGDAAGQGFLHGFAGMVLFLTALLLIISTDSALRLVDKQPAPLPVAPAPTHEAAP